jgi:WS/DGAT/MGAT family acyltransferase
VKQLSGTDNYFLYGERGNSFLHVATLAIYDPATAPGGKVRFRDILKHFRERLHVSPVLTQRLAEVPYGLDRPYWVEGPDVDIEFHVRHMALPQPGDWRQLMIQVARIHSRPLDRSRPLWEAYVIEGLARIPGLASGAFAIFTKFHHASVDGMAGVRVFRDLHSTSPRGRPPRRASRPASDAAIAEAPLDASVLANGVDRLVTLSKLSAVAAGRFAGIIAREAQRRLGAEITGRYEPAALPMFQRAPATRFNRPISANRVVTAIEIPLVAMQPIRAAVEGATVNDVFLAVASGALRRYLASRDELPRRSLIGGMPISLRGDAGTGGNDVTAVPVALCTDVVDPLARLLAIHRTTLEAKRNAKAMGLDFTPSLIDAMPAAVTNLVVRGVALPGLNVAVSNVRGPDAPLYFAGARLARLYPVSAIADGQGLNLTAVTYDGVFALCAVACRNMLPDPGFFADCLRESFAELAAAAEAGAPMAKRAARKPGRGG